MGATAAASSSSTSVATAGATASQESTSVGAGVAVIGSEGSTSAGAGHGGSNVQQRRYYGFCWYGWYCKKNEGSIIASAGQTGEVATKGNTGAAAGEAGKGGVVVGKQGKQGQPGQPSQASGKEATHGGGESGSVASGPVSAGGSQSKYGLNIPGQSRDATEKAIEQAGQIDALLQQAGPAQLALMKYLAQKEGDKKYVVPAFEWINLILTATDKIGDDDLAYLITLEWNPGEVTAEQLRADIHKARQHKEIGKLRLACSRIEKPSRR